ncbi:BET1-like protein isoform X1 [Pseudopipra pipra]|uniref:BET1-like protein isoform X1 n=1 Tax=Pseudopipra pipra TaxID=415032 RepID=UPI00313993BA
MPRGWDGGDPLCFWGDGVSQWTTAHIPLFRPPWLAPPLATSFPRHLGTFQPPFLCPQTPIFVPSPYLCPQTPTVSATPPFLPRAPAGLWPYLRPGIPRGAAPTLPPRPGGAARGSRCRGEGGGGGGGRSGGHFVAAPPGGAGRSGAAMAERGRGQSPSAMEDLLDVENKRMADSLASKVTRLKSLALDIDKDAEEQNRYLDGMDSDFLSVTGLLTGSVKRFSTMARSGRDNRRLLCAVSVALILIFFILYYLVSRAGT